MKMKPYLLAATIILCSVAFFALVNATIGNNGLWGSLFPKSGFTDADIDAVKTSIKSEFGKRDGITVSEVTMIRETPRKLVGFAKLRIGAPIAPATPKVVETSCSDGPRPNIDCAYPPSGKAVDFVTAFHFDIIKNCSATMSSDAGAGYLWQCE
jgi:hypothetical protein